MPKGRPLCQTIYIWAEWQYPPMKQKKWPWFKTDWTPRKDRNGLNGKEGNNLMTVEKASFIWPEEDERKTQNAN